MLILSILCIQVPLSEEQAFVERQKNFISDGYITFLRLFRRLVLQEE